MTKKHFSLRIDDFLLKKLRYIAGYNARSINGEIVTSVKKYIMEFELKNGRIDISKIKEDE